MLFVKAGRERSEDSVWEGWHDAELRVVKHELLAIAGTAVSRELDSRRELNARLSATIAFAGLLLAAAFGFGYRAGRLDLGGLSEDLLAACFVMAVLILVLAVLSRSMPFFRTREMD